MKPAREETPAVSGERAAVRRAALPSPWPSRARAALAVLAAAYLVTVWLDGVGSTVPARLMPRVWVYFAQVAALFPHAADMVIDYRAEGWSCADRRWEEIDVRPYFQLEANTKESRFARTLYFYRKNRPVMQALEQYVIARHDAASSSSPIGGIRFLSLRIPIPPVGARVEPWSRRPVASFPKEQRHDWYWTPRSRRLARCNASSAPNDADEAEP